MEVFIIWITRQIGMRGQQNSLDICHTMQVKDGIQLKEPEIIL
jgi:hypothetical protein